MTVPTRGKAPTFNIYLLYHNITLPKSQPISAAKREAHADGENGTWRFDVPVLKWRKRQKGDEKMELKTQVHNIPPLYDEKSRVLILGSFPSVKSREAAFFYAHPQNRFWPTLAAVLARKRRRRSKRRKRWSCAAASPCGTPSAHARSWDRRMRASRTLCRTICPSFWMRRTFRPSSATAARPTPAIKILPREARARGRPDSLHLAGQRALDEGKAYRSVGRSAETVSFLTRR